jgi:hypothetical protein
VAKKEKSRLTGANLTFDRSYIGAGPEHEKEWMASNVSLYLFL